MASERKMRVAVSRLMGPDPLPINHDDPTPWDLARIQRDAERLGRCLNLHPERIKFEFCKLTGVSLDDG